MHPSAYAIVERFEREHLRKSASRLSVLDVGAYDVNGTYKAIFPPSKYAYTGVDVEKGPNVDRVVQPYDFGSEQYDVVISGSCMEHVEDIFAWSNALMAVCREGGMVCVNAPHTWPQHRHPVDCWRIFPDGMRFAFRELKILECDCNDSDTWIYAIKKKATAAPVQPSPPAPQRVELRMWRRGRPW